MRSQEQASESPQVTFAEAKAYLAWLSKTQGKNADLLSLDELLMAQSTNQIVMLGKEWTKEGWIYDPILKRVDKEPKPSARAFFREAVRK